MLSTIIDDIQVFKDTVSKFAPKGIRLWAFTYPLQQLLWGAWSAVAVGPTSVGAQYFFQRLLSTIVINRVNAKRPFDKKMGPIGHLNLYFALLPYSINWLLISTPSSGTSMTDKMHYGFVLYTSACTAVSLLLDSRVMYHMALGKDPGLYPYAPPEYGGDKKAE